ncbi:hypothetical protein SAMN02927916_3933 [Flavobacterium anhuiense]|uniref:Uncharacterized protein n=1 Tax=Flavobacterium anhuiense TaxID=459526 RepID=A0ABY0M1C3_9FLAO|nr:hypothetical protein [Flavobacterium anhuiense]SCY90426.1 hypothetical protein SAMN02927916_3933 [Flavobacterium anhuiense]
MTEQDVFKAFHDYYKEFPYNVMEIKFSFTLAGSYDVDACYFYNGTRKETALDGRELFAYERFIYEVFKSRAGTDDQFNIAVFQIQHNGIYSSEYRWESEEAKKNLLDYAEVFYQWVHERMMSMIFEYEKEKGLLPVQNDDDGDLEYLSSWDSGVFTFHITDKNELEHIVMLAQDGKERVLDMPLKDYFREGILEHHKITNVELADEWKPWNTMILKSLHYDIPHDKKDEFVKYI